MISMLHAIFIYRVFLELQSARTFLVELQSLNFKRESTSMSNNLVFQTFSRSKFQTLYYFSSPPPI